MRCARQRRLAALALVLGGFHGLGWAWSPFGGGKSEFEEVALTPAEWSQVQVEGGMGHRLPGRPAL
jgi:hypothetical protein